jgi:site-specific recombinase XerD
MVINIIGGKGSKDRQVMLDDKVLDLLEIYYRKYKPVDYVLNGQSKDQYTTTSVRQVVKQLAGKANINKRVWVHLIRHCTFTHLVEQCVDINVISKLAGHANVKTTHLYTHISHNIISKIPSPIKLISV